jgi:hypothetical protein
MFGMPAISGLAIFIFAQIASKDAETQRRPGEIVGQHNRDLQFFASSWRLCEKFLSPFEISIGSGLQVWNHALLIAPGPELLRR